MTDEERSVEIHMLRQAKLTLKNHLKPYLAFLKMERDLIDVEARLAALEQGEQLDAAAPTTTTPTPEQPPQTFTGPPKPKVRR